MFLNKIKENNSVDKLGNILEIKKGVEVGSASYKETGIPFIRVSNMTKFGIRYTSSKFISKELYEELRDNFQPQIDEVLITKDATPAISTVQRQQVNQIISGGIIRGMIKDKIDLDYLSLVINSPVVQLQVERDASGSIIKHWKTNDIKNTVIPLIQYKKQVDIGNNVRKSLESYNKFHSKFNDAVVLVENNITELIS